jgi:hypothetical protein
MPLIKENLEQQLATFIDPNNPNFQGTPKDLDENANKWTEAIDLYAKTVLPPVTPASIILAAISFKSVMSGLSEPVVEYSSPQPFTLYYISPENRLYRFNAYLRDKVGYKSNPSLDKTSVFTILKKIRLEYNRLYPLYALTEEDIVYNQKRFNQIYAQEILEGKIIPLKGDGVTTNTSDDRYKFIPTDRRGKIIRLQDDGIIGDDTIRYFPTVAITVYVKYGNAIWNLKYAAIKFFTQPSNTGEVFLSKPVKRKDGNYETQKRASILTFQKDFIDKGLSKDYTIYPIDKTQFQTDGLSPISTVAQFKAEFEKNHSTCDPVWIKNHLSTIEEFLVFKKIDYTIYKAKPSIQKDGIEILESAIKTYALQLAIGMLPAFTGAPSPAPINLKSVTPLGLAGASNSDCIKAMSTLIDIYFRSGTATNNTSGATTTWQ